MLAKKLSLFSAFDAVIKIITEGRARSARILIEATMARLGVGCSEC